MIYNVLCISNNVTYKINYFLILDYIHFFLTKINLFDPNLNHCMQKDNITKLIDIIKVKYLIKVFHLDYCGLIISINIDQ